MTGPRHDPTRTTRFLDPGVLAAIGNLELLARTVVEGFLHGLHRSPHLGLSMEFAEHRPYNPGDDIRRIDWRVLARTDRFYVKEFEAETHASVTFLLDISPSMSFASGTVSKLDYARFLVASLAWFSARQRDRIGLITFDGSIRETIPPSTRHLTRILHALDRLTPGTGGEPGRALGAIADRVRRRSILVIVSDFYDQPESLLEGVTRLRATGSDVLAFHVVDPAEREFPYEGAATFEDLESGERIPLVPGDLRGDYQSMIAEHQATLTRHMGSQGVDYAILGTDQPLDHALFAYLSRRQAMARIR
jgi:uncharacterized protein (DUF58 family)